MTNFKLNVSSLNENIDSYKSLKSNCLSDLDVIYNSLKNTDSGWHDNNTVVFTNIVKKDKYKLDNYFKKLDSLYKQIENLRNGFQNLFFKYGYNKNAMLRYNDEYYELCIKALNNASSYLNSALQYANSCRFKSGFSAYSDVYTLRSEIRKLKSSTSSIATQVKNFRSSVNRTLSNANNYINRIGNVSLDIEPFLYNWKLSDAAITVKSIDEQKIDGVHLGTISTDSEVLSNESYLRNTTSANSVVENVVNRDQVRDNNVYNNSQGVVSYAANSNNINANSEVLSNESYLRNTTLASNVSKNVVDTQKIKDNSIYDISQGVSSYAVNQNTINVDSSGADGVNNGDNLYR